MNRRQQRQILEIEQVLAKYCRAIDRCDWDLLRNCYHRGAIDEHGAYNGDVDGFVDWLRIQLPQYEMTMHFLGGVVVHFAGRSSANVESYCLALHRSSDPVTGAMSDRVIGVRYVDEFTRTAGQWAIQHRRCLYDFGRIDLVHGADQALTPAYRRGASGQGDPSYPAMDE
jgi:hypothetical protein